MDLAFTPEEDAFRAEVRAFLDTHLTDDLRRAAQLTSGVYAEYEVAMRWQRILDTQGWSAYSWPKAAGGPGWSPIRRYIFEKECADAGAPILPNMGLRLVGPVIYTFGSAEQQARYLPALRSGADFWAQGFSEPGAGSDLASLKTRAVLNGDHYVVNGSKIWTTLAQHANRLFCLVRTDTRVKPQRGISFLLIDMDQPGVRVRPILSASGDHEVNEVFLDDVIVPLADRVGEEGQGWSIAKFLLENERGGTCFAPGLLADIRRFRSLAPVAQSKLLARLDRLQIEAEALEITELRGLAALAATGDAGPQALATKLIASELRQAVEQLGFELLGCDALFPSSGAGRIAEADVAAARYLNSRAWSIFGGTSEIQQDIIARAIGL